jgi:mycothiol synthase
VSGTENNPESDAVTVRPMADEEAGEVLALLDRAERSGGAPLVDEAEHERLRRLAAGEAPRAGEWHSLVATRGETPVGYTAMVVSGVEATADAAVLGDDTPDTVLAPLLSGLSSLAGQHDVRRLQVWMRHVGDREIAVATGAGFRVERRLGVLGRSLDGHVAAPTSGGSRVRHYRPGQDDEAVVEVLAGAYGDSPEAGWDLEQFHEKRRLPWFRAEDLLLAEVPADGHRPARIGGLHWLKRREPGVGEVYNLAIHPGAQGAGLGALLLAAGLEHLVRIGCGEVILWVDLANEPAVALYTSQGFATRWEDVALVRTLE